jgi:hypothetical protein
VLRAADRSSRCGKSLATHDRIALTVSFARQRERRKGDSTPRIRIDLALGCCDRGRSRLMMQACGGALRRKAPGFRAGGDLGVDLDLRPNYCVRAGSGQRRGHGNSERDGARDNAIASAHGSASKATFIRYIGRQAIEDRLSSVKLSVLAKQNIDVNNSLRRNAGLGESFSS